ncbi:hypothetical protein [Dolosicoccus paucivorans]|uniref:PepSY domain-containing protein n=1 Tax=Dolosicoccus paucivorans TaxID=84521 RepID=A0A1G8J378_9LACT|nr:hypothetical protein [Dolosicoccus paucivorans]PMB84412.1 hypothetical protein CJ206_04075 [Dolosicoccus paucivorans]PMC59059.1 hypothetical protein CJ205_00930 [Dolosicoccus paucivorans]SDI25513.1 hypothetical protein SAMN04487994_100318 [Dolosicoccus paucivorans]
MKLLIKGMSLLLTVTLFSGCQHNVSSNHVEKQESFEESIVLPTNEEVIEAVISYRKEHQQAIDSAEYVYQVTYDETHKRYFIEVGENHTDQMIVVAHYQYNPITGQVLEENEN